MIRRPLFFAGLSSIAFLIALGVTARWRSTNLGAAVTIHNTFVASPTSLPAGGGNVTFQWQYDQPTWNGNGAVIEYGQFHCNLTNGAGQTVAGSATSLSGIASVSVRASDTFNLSCGYAYYAAGSWSQVPGPSGSVSISVATAPASSSASQGNSTGGGGGGGGGGSSTIGGGRCGDGIHQSNEICLDLAICDAVPGKICCPQDCASASRSSRSSAAPPPRPANCNISQCNDNIDNDGDGQKDLADSGCQDTYDTTEQEVMKPLTGGACMTVDQDASGVGNIAINCPAGYLSVGGGWRGYGVTDDSLDVSRPLSGNTGWECAKNPPGSDSICSAVCCRTETIDVMTITVKSPLQNHPQPQCPAGFTITGGGFADGTPAKDEDILRPEEGNAWHCYDDDSVNADSYCYAVCARKKNGDALNCVSQVVGSNNGESTIKTNCVTGTTVTGGGFLDNSTGNDDTDSNSLYGNGWLCTDDFGDSTAAPSLCYARCCTIPAPKAAACIRPTSSSSSSRSSSSKSPSSRSSSSRSSSSQSSLPGSTSSSSVSSTISTSSTTSSRSSISSSVASSASSALSSTPTTSSSAVTLACGGNACGEGGTQFCAVSGQTCQNSDTAPCFVCSASACDGNACAGGGTAYCGISGQTCQESADAPCFACAGGAICSGHACGDGGAAYCAIAGKSCQESNDSPCFACGEASTAISWLPLSLGGSSTSSSPFGLVLGINDITAPGLCGDSTKEGDEECDDGNTQNGDGCTAQCLLERGFCGDGVIERALDEQCDVGQRLPAGMSCTTTCRLLSSSCGNGQRDAGEECDGGQGNNDRPGSRCRTDCSLARCGDGILDAPQEQCDDHNHIEGDGCSTTCARELPTQSQLPPNAAAPAMPQQLQTVTMAPPSHAPVGSTGPGSLAAMAAGAASGLALVRRRRERKSL